MNHAAYYHNKVIWITGASSGIGAELALQLAKKDAQLVLSARDVFKLNELKGQLLKPFELKYFQNPSEKTEK